MIRGTPSKGPLSPREDPGSHLTSCPTLPEQWGVCPGAGGGGTGKAAWTLLLSWGGERCHGGRSPLSAQGPGLPPGLLHSLLAEPQGPAARLRAGHSGPVHLHSSQMQWAASAVPQKANIDASEAIVRPAALSPPSDPVGMIFPGLC